MMRPNPKTQALSAVGATEESALAFADLAVARQSAGDSQGALHAYQCALDLNPHCLPALINTLIILESRRDHAAMQVTSGALIQVLEKLLAADPGNAEHHKLLGHAWRWAGQPQQAINSYTRALEHAPADFETLVNIGHIHHDLSQLARCVEWYGKAADVIPGNATAWMHLGNALGELSRYNESVECLQRAVALAPDNALAQCFLGNALRCVNRSSEAIDALRTAVALKPELPVIHWNLARALLVAGDFSGWNHFEARWDVPALKLTHRYRHLPPWRGEESVAGRTVLLHAEQGYGDTLQFCRYAPLLAVLGARVVLQVQRSLVGLLGSLPGVAQVIAAEETAPPFDMHCPLMSLPLALGTTATSVPHAPCYLAADPLKVNAWAQRLGPKTASRIGLVWNGNPIHLNDAERSLPLQMLLDALPSGFEYICLQNEVRDSDLQALQADTLGVRFVGSGLRDFADTAALCTLMDLVISVDTSVAHLAGALGTNTWVLLPFCPDYRWMLERADSPWYPTFTLLRQQSRGDWNSVLQLVRSSLEQVA